MLYFPLMDITHKNNYSNGLNLCDFFRRNIWTQFLAKFESPSVMQTVVKIPIDWSWEGRFCQEKEKAEQQFAEQEEKK